MSYLAGLFNPNYEQDTLSSASRSLAADPFEDNTPGVFEGLSDERTIDKAITRGLIVEPAIAGSLALSNLPRAIDAAAETELTDLWHKTLTDPLVKTRQSLLPDPMTTGVGTQVIDSLVSLLPQAAVFGAAGTGVVTGIAETTQQLNEGKDLDTAAKLGALTGGVNALGIKLPAAAATSRIKVPMLAQRLGTGAAGNVALGAGAEQARGELLQDAGYTDEAKHYRWDNPQNRAIDLVLGLAFGGLAHVQAPKINIKPSDIDAALTLNDARHAEQAAPGEPLNAKAINDHVRSLHQAMDQLTAGDEVTAQVDAALFHPDTRLDEHRRSLDSELAAHIDQEEFLNAGRQFADRTGRRFEEQPTYTDGTAHLLPQVLDFYDQHVAPLPAKGKDLMPDVLFRIGEVSDSVAAGLRDFLPGFNDKLREARISAQSIKHIHDSRPGIARDVLQRLEQGVLRADEVLPNPQHPERALLVVKNYDPDNPRKRGSTVIEVSANGKGIDVVTSMTGEDRSLKKARDLKKQIEGSRSEGQHVDTRPNSPHRHLPDQDQTHAAADSLHFERDSQSVDQAQAKVNTTDTPELAAVRQILAERGDTDIFYRDDDGNEQTASLSQLLDELDNDMNDANHIDAALQAAITCFLRFGD